MRPLTSFAVPIGINHAFKAELTFWAAPIERHHNVRAIRGVYSCRVERECSLQLATRENYSREIAALQPINQPLGYCGLVVAHIKQDGAAVSADENVAGLRCLGKFFAGVKT